ncbi:hypothetical protein ACTHQ4_10695 [Alkalicoccobacillus gibsonii]|uniref:hypothetical protein n=1 Tax=Alkalicoccobacillus gibsonii TaxID=79881 RepID=UPI003F7CA0B9
MLKDLSEKHLRKIHLQEKKIGGIKNVPHYSLIASTKKELEAIFLGSGRINPKYAKETLIALDYAKNHYHYITGFSMLNDIVTHQKIVFNNYR